MEPSQKSIESIINIIVNTVHPVKIILFGSAARDSFHEYSDLELAKIAERPKVMLETLCFHAQQSAEKSIKMYW